jgi:hypothetical protein
LGPDIVAAACLLVVASAVAALAAAQSLALAYPVMVVLGFASIGTISSFMIAAQSVLPDWVRGRGVAVVGLVFQAGFALGAAAWGAIAVRAGVTATLAAAAAFIAAGSLLGLRMRLSSAEDLDVTAAHAPVPYPPVSLAADDGPVQLSVEYTVHSVDLAAFRAAASQLCRARARSGAMHWGLYSDVHDPTRQVEVFTVSSWAEHLRQTDRETEADHDLAETVLAFHRGPAPAIQRALLSEHGTLPRHRPGRTRETEGLRA